MYALTGIIVFLLVFFGVFFDLYKNGDSPPLRKLIRFISAWRSKRARMKLYELTKRYERYELQIKDFESIHSLEALAKYLTQLGCTDENQVIEKLDLNIHSIYKWLGDFHYIRSRRKWVVSDPDEKWGLYFREAMFQETKPWLEWMRNARPTMDALRAKIAKLEEKPAVRKAPVRVEIPPPDPSNKRAKLQKVRVQIAELRATEEKLEKEILQDEHGEPLPNRTPAGIATD